MNGQKTNGAIDIFNIFAAIIFIASAMLTFGFFYVNLPAIVPDFVGVFGASIISGVLGLVILDGGALAWLHTYLHATENNDQRNIAMQSSVIDIVGSAIASFAQIVLTAEMVTLTAQQQNIAAWVSLFVVAAVLSVNFINLWRYRKNSNAAKDAIKQADRDAKIQQAEDEHNKNFDDMVANKVTAKLAARADELAEMQADKVVANRVMIERNKGFGLPQTETPAIMAADNAQQPPTPRKRKTAPKKRKPKTKPVAAQNESEQVTANFQ